MNMNLKQLKQIIFNEIKPNIIIKGNNSFSLSNNKKFFKQIKQKYNWFTNISELIYLVKNYNNLENIHIFCYCGKKNKFHGIHGYSQYCCISCAVKSDKFQIRRNKTMLKLYGDKCNSKKVINTKLNNIDKNGLNSIQRGSIKTRIKKLNDIDKNGLNSYQRSVIKHKQTCLKKYGVDSYFKTLEYKIKYNNKQNIEKRKQKEYQTKIKNNTFRKSKKEDKCYQLLLQKFNKDDIFRQYKSSLYPFYSDFYIKSLDLYIECHFSQFHNYKPFKNSVEDLQKLKEFKNKNSKYYNNIIYTWYNLDPLKLQTFKQNNLNYKIFYNLNQFKKWNKCNGNRYK